MPSNSLGKFIVGLGLVATPLTDGLTRVDVDTKNWSKKMTKNFDLLKKPMQELRGMLIGTFSIAALTSAVKYFDTIDGAVKKMNVGISNSRKGMADFGGLAKGIYSSLPISIDQATESVTLLANKTKLAGEELKKAVKQAGSLAALTGGSSATGTSLIAMKRWGVDESNFNRYTDFIYSVAKDAGLGAAGIEKINRALADTDNTLGRFGYSMEDVAKMVAALEADGRDVGGVMGSLNKSISEMVSNNDVANLSEGWKKMREEVEKLQTPKEKISYLEQYFGSKGQASEMLEVFEVMDKALKNSSINMENLSDAFYNSLTDLQKLSISAKNFADNMARGISVISQGKSGTWLDNWFGKGKDFVAPSGAGGLDMLPKKHFSISYQTEEEAKKLEAVKETTDKLAESTNEAAKATGSMANSLTDVKNAASWTDKNLANLSKNMDTRKSEWFNFSITLKDSITDSFTDIITQTKSVSEAFRNMVANILSYITKLYVEQNIAAPIASSLTKLTGNFMSGFGGIGSSSASGGGFNFFGGSAADAAFSGITGFADGGSVYAGQPTVVGDAGRELFVPKVDGRIIPSSGIDRAGGSSGVTVNQSFTISAGTPQEVEAQMRIMIAKAKSEIASSVADVARRGGKTSSMIRNGV